MNPSNARSAKRIPERVDRTANFLLACLLFPFALLIIAVIYILFLIRVGSPRPSFLYSGIRLGRDFKPFTMYKVRTLLPDPEYEELGVILPPGSGRELPMGRLLRESRLAELPQLWNVLRGDMNLVGPRPLRPAVYKQIKSELPNFDSRFQVKPGLTGYAQFLTPPHTPKRVRFAIDNYYITRDPSPGKNLFLVAWTIREVIRKSLTSMFRQVTTRMKIMRHRGSGIEERKLQRKRFKHIWVQMSDASFSNSGEISCPADPKMCSPSQQHFSLTHIYDISSQALSFYSSRHYPLNSTLYFYLVGCKECKTGRKKKARCIGTVYKKYPEKPGSGTGSRYVVFYEPLSPTHRYLVDHYVLHETVA